MGLKHAFSGPYNTHCFASVRSPLSQPLPHPGPLPLPHPNPQIFVTAVGPAALAFAAVGLPVAAGVGAAGIGLGVLGVTGFVSNLGNTISNFNNIGDLVDNGRRRRSVQRQYSLL